MTNLAASVVPTKVVVPVLQFLQVDPGDKNRASEDLLVPTQTRFSSNRHVPGTHVVSTVT